MTIMGWVYCIFFMLLIAGFGLYLVKEVFSSSKFVVWIVVFILCGLVFYGFRFYYNNTASGKRALIDQRSELNNGLERCITIYTADGNVIAQYEGNIDIKGNDGGYVLFDFEGKRYTYYNCFVESVAEIE